jgi:hypothetical protein
LAERRFDNGIERRDERKKLAVAALSRYLLVV